MGALPKMKLSDIQAMGGVPVVSEPPIQKMKLSNIQAAGGVPVEQPQTLQPVTDGQGQAMTVGDGTVMQQSDGTHWIVYPGGRKEQVVTDIASPNNASSTPETVDPRQFLTVKNTSAPVTGNIPLSAPGATNAQRIAYMLPEPAPRTTPEGGPVMGPYNGSVGEPTLADLPPDMRPALAAKGIPGLISPERMQHAADVSPIGAATRIATGQKEPYPAPQDFWQTIIDTGVGLTQLAPLGGAGGLAAKILLPLGVGGQASENVAAAGGSAKDIATEGALQAGLAALAGPVGAKAAAPIESAIGKTLASGAAQSGVFTGGNKAAEAARYVNEHWDELDKMDAPQQVAKIYDALGGTEGISKDFLGNLLLFGGLSLPGHLGEVRNKALETGRVAEPSAPSETNPNTINNIPANDLPSSEASNPNTPPAPEPAPEPARYTSFQSSGRQWERLVNAAKKQYSESTPEDLQVLLDGGQLSPAKTEAVQRLIEENKVVSAPEIVQAEYRPGYTHESALTKDEVKTLKRAGFAPDEQGYYRGEFSGAGAPDLAAAERTGPSEGQNIPKTPATKPGTHSDIGSLYDDAVQGGTNKRRWVDLGAVTKDEVVTIREKTGIDVTPEYRHTIDDSAIRHIERRHGAEGKADSSITREDIARIPDILRAPDEIEDGGLLHGDSGPRTIKYVKRVNGDIYYLEERRTGRKELAASTLYKKKAPESGVAHTSETNPVVNRALRATDQGAEPVPSAEDLNAKSDPTQQQPTGSFESGLSARAANDVSSVGTQRPQTTSVSIEQPVQGVKKPPTPQGPAQASGSFGDALARVLGRVFGYGEAFPETPGSAKDVAGELDGLVSEASKQEWSREPRAARAIKAVQRAANTLRNGGKPNEEILQSAADVLRRSEAAAQTIQSGTATPGRPDLANIGRTEPVQQAVNAIDTTRNAAGEPAHRPDVEVTAEAERLLSDTTTFRKSVVDKANNGEQLSDAETAAARTLFNKEMTGAIESGDFERIKQASVLGDAYRRTGTEQGRAFRMRRTDAMTPEERAVGAIADIISEPRPKAKNDLRKLDEQIREGGATAEEAKRRREVIQNREAIRTQHDLEKLRKLGHNLSNVGELAKNPDETARLYQDAMALKGTSWDAAYEFWVNAILSGPKTHMANVVGNAASTAWDFTGQRLAEIATNLAVRDPRSPQLGDFHWMGRAFIPAIQRAIRMSLNAWKTEQAMFGDEVAGGRGSKFEHRAAISGTKGRIVRAPSRAMLAADQFAKGFIGHVEVMVQAGRITKAEGLTGDARGKRVAQLVGDLNSEAWSAAIKKAEELTFNSELGKGGRWLMEGRNAIPGFRYILPFIRTPMNMLKMGLRKTPLGLANIARRAATDPTYTKQDLVRHIGEQLIAIPATIALAHMLGLNDDEKGPFITGSAPAGNRKGERDLSNRAAPPQSICIGDKWYSYARVEPFATAITPLVDAITTFQRWQHGQDPGALAGDVWRYFVSQTTDKSFMKGVSDIVQAVEDPNHAISWASNFATSWVPNLLKQPLQAADPFVRDLSTSGKGIDFRARLANRLEYQALPMTPAQGQAPFPAVDVWGREISKQTGFSPGTDWLWRTLVPLDARQPESRPGIEQNLDRLILNYNNAHPNTVWAPVRPEPTFTMKDRKGKSVSESWTPAEYHDLCVKAGEKAVQLLQSRSLHVDAPTDRDIRVIKIVLERSRVWAKAQLLRQRMRTKRMTTEQASGAMETAATQAGIDLTPEVPAGSESAPEE